jgi:hypothetical protein
MRTLALLAAAPAAGADRKPEPAVPGLTASGAARALAGAAGGPLASLPLGR